jgi:hypothetical protein
MQGKLNILELGFMLATLVAVFCGPVLSVFSLFLQFPEPGNYLIAFCIVAVIISLFVIFSIFAKKNMVRRWIRTSMLAINVFHLLFYIVAAIVVYINVR